jgi:hypothetical protein
MIGLFGRIRFRHMEFLKVEEIQLLLDACAETLETLRFEMCDPQGEGVSLEGVQVTTNGLSAEHLDLSRIKFLRALEFPLCNAYCMDVPSPPEIPASILSHTFSTITSPAFSEVTLFCREGNYPGSYEAPWSGPPMTFSFWQGPYSEECCVLEYRMLFRMIHKLQRVRDFKLVLCANVWGVVIDHAVRELEWLVETTWVEGESGEISSRPLVTCSPLGLLPVPGEQPMNLGVSRVTYPWAPERHHRFSVFSPCSPFS